ncbi:MAG TPA: hypothetical protein VJY62_05370, partial [Bacteroidia bacterium]|nr:hypothetical protein [Bacteroidia bacterium]
QPVMNLNEVNGLLKNPSSYQGKKEKNAWRWFGSILLVGLAAFGILYLFNNNSSIEDKTGNSVAITNNIPSDNNAVQANASSSENKNEASAAPEKNDINTSSSENSLAANNKEDKNTAVSKPAMAPEKPGSKPAAMTKHYAGDVNINFSSDNKKIKMIISPSNEIAELKINDELISAQSYTEYKNIIDEGLKLKNEKITGEGGNSEVKSLSAAKRNVMNAMMKELTADGLISSDKPFDFTLTGQEIFLNNEKQTAETFEKYKEVYEKLTGEKLPAKYNLHIKR